MTEENRLMNPHTVLASVALIYACIILLPSQHFKHFKQWFLRVKNMPHKLAPDIRARNTEIEAMFVVTDTGPAYKKYWTQSWANLCFFSKVNTDGFALKFIEQTDEAKLDSLIKDAPDEATLKERRAQQVFYDGKEFTKRYASHALPVDSDSSSSDDDDDDGQGKDKNSTVSGEDSSLKTPEGKNDKKKKSGGKKKEKKSKQNNGGNRTQQQEVENQNPNQNPNQNQQQQQGRPRQIRQSETLSADVLEMKVSQSYDERTFVRDLVAAHDGDRSAVCRAYEVTPQDKEDLDAYFRTRNGQWNTNNLDQIFKEYSDKKYAGVSGHVRLVFDTMNSLGIAFDSEDPYLLAFINKVTTNPLKYKESNHNDTVSNKNTDERHMIATFLSEVYGTYSTGFKLRNFAKILHGTLAFFSETNRYTAVLTYLLSHFNNTRFAPILTDIADLLCVTFARMDIEGSNRESTGATVAAALTEKNLADGEFMKNALARYGNGALTFIKLCVSYGISCSRYLKNAGFRGDFDIRNFKADSEIFYIAFEEIAGEVNSTRGRMAANTLVKDAGRADAATTLQSQLATDGAYVSPLQNLRDWVPLVNKLNSADFVLGLGHHEFFNLLVNNAKDSSRPLPSLRDLAAYRNPKGSGEGLHSHQHHDDRRNHGRRGGLGKNIPKESGSRRQRSLEPSEKKTYVCKFHGNFRVSHKPADCTLNPEHSKFIGEAAAASALARFEERMKKSGKSPANKK